MGIEVRGVLTLLQVFDMPTSVRFYREVLGFEIVQTTTPRESDQFDWGCCDRTWADCSSPFCNCTP